MPSEPSGPEMIFNEGSEHQSGWLDAGGRAAGQQLQEQQAPPREVPPHVLRCEPVGTQSPNCCQRCVRSTFVIASMSGP